MSTDLTPDVSPAPSTSGQGASNAATPAEGGGGGGAAAGEDGQSKTTTLDSSKAAGTANQGQDGAAATATEKQNVRETPEELRAQLDILRRELAGNLQKKQNTDKALVAHESSIYAFESSYLSVDLGAGNANTSFGNIVRGYDAYLKSGSASHADTGRKKGSSSSSRGGGAAALGGYGGAILGPGGALIQPINEEERLFSKSSTTYQDSLNLRERDTGALSASEPEDEDDGASSTGQGPTKRQKKK